MTKAKGFDKETLSIPIEKAAILAPRAKDNAAEWSLLQDRRSEAKLLVAGVAEGWSYLQK